MTQTNSSNQNDQLLGLSTGEEDESKNRSGVSSLQLDPLLNRLYSGGRDSIIRAYQSDKFLFAMKSHTSWVSDIILCCGGRYLVSASFDTVVKVWNAHEGSCEFNLRVHTDYVKALAYAKDREQMASAGLDRCIYLWDINTLTAVTSTNCHINTSKLPGTKDSIYSLGMNSAGTIIVSGSTERKLRVWDPRTCIKLFKLGLNAINVKALVVSADGAYCISGSTDTIIRLWSLTMKRCIHRISVHTDSVWALLADDNFTYVLSGGRDKRVVMTDLENPRNSVLVCMEEAPILKMCFTQDQKAIWVATSNSDIRCWKLPSAITLLNSANDINNNNVQTVPLLTIPGVKISNPL